MSAISPLLTTSLHKLDKRPSLQLPSKQIVGTQLVGHGLQRPNLLLAGKHRERSHGNPKSATRAGLPVISSVPVLGPLVNFVLSPIVVLGIYAFGASKFFSGFSRTTYDDALPSKLGLTLAWPVLFVVSQAYRSNFKRAIR